jgi:sugar phosphate isomerase/epimerase
MTRNELGLHGVTMTTDVLTGATRKTLELLRDRGDKAGCAILGLIESEPVHLADSDDDKALSGVERMLRVLQAASVLGCNAVGVRVPGPANDAAAELAAERLKLVTERAERLEINVLVIPQPGLCATPERLTSLVKAVGGFRIGTLPEFDAAFASGEAATYLKRLTPYASLVNAVTLGFTEPEPTAAPVRSPDRSPDRAAPPANAAKPDAPIVGLDLGGDDDDGPLLGGDAAPDDDAKPAAKPTKKSTKKASAKPAPAKKPAPPPPADDEDDEGFDDADLAALLAEAAAELADEPEAPPPVHTAFPLDPLVQAIVAVGFDGTLAIEYRGPGDCKLGVIQSREALDAALRAAADR